MSDTENASAKPVPTRMTDRNARAVLDLLERAGVTTWVAGGWGVDALVGRESRPHSDLDVLIPRPMCLQARTTLASAGFVETLDQRPTRFEMTHPKLGVVDLHPIELEAEHRPRLQLPNGAWWIYGEGALDAHGRIGSRRCRCLSAREQLQLHHGYEPRDIDRADIALLRAHTQAAGTTRSDPGPSPREPRSSPPS